MKLTKEKILAGRALLILLIAAYVFFGFALPPVIDVIGFLFEQQAVKIAWAIIGCAAVLPVGCLLAMDRIIGYERGRQAAVAVGGMIAGLILRGIMTLLGAV